MATSTGNSLFARARTIASQVMSDANQSVVIDNLGGLRALLNNTIRELYRDKARDQKFTRDIVTRNTVTMTAGTGTCPDTVMRETLPHFGQFQDDNGSLITYYNYQIDAESGKNFNQLGYVWLQGDTFHYTAPSPTLNTYAGNLFVTCPTFPTLPGVMSDTITFPSETIIDDLVLALAAAITGNLSWDDSFDAVKRK